MSYPQPIQKIIDLFVRFPGIGPRQAGRFAFYLLGEKPETVKALAGALHALHGEVGFCGQCYSSVAKKEGVTYEIFCKTCLDKDRDNHAIMILEKEADLVNIERTKRFNGHYHILGGTIDPLDSTAPARLHIKELFKRVKGLKENGKSVEVILATNATTDGDATALYLERVLQPLEVKITRLGRGLTTGTELEYSDEATIVNALTNRK